LNELGKIAESPILKAINADLGLFQKTSEAPGQYVEIMNSTFRYAMAFYETEKYGDAYAVNIPHMKRKDGLPYRTFLIPAYFESDKKASEVFEDIRKEAKKKPKRKIILDEPVEDIFADDENDDSEFEEEG
jgi:hypothetical protein